MRVCVCSSVLHVCVCVCITFTAFGGPFSAIAMTQELRTQVIYCTQKNAHGKVYREGSRENADLSKLLLIC